MGEQIFPQPIRVFVYAIPTRFHPSSRVRVMSVTDEYQILIWGIKALCCFATKFPTQAKTGLEWATCRFDAWLTRPEAVHIPAA